MGKQISNHDEEVDEEGLNEGGLEPVATQGLESSQDDSELRLSNVVPAAANTPLDAADGFTRKTSPSWLTRLQAGNSILQPMDDEDWEEIELQAAQTPPKSKSNK